MTDVRYRTRNWYYLIWLSGDFNVEQHVHYLDVCAWLMNGYPTKAIGMGGRQVRTDAMYGNIFDHHSVTYEFDNGSRLFSNTRQQPGCTNSSTANPRWLGFSPSNSASPSVRMRIMRRIDTPFLHLLAGYAIINSISNHTGRDRGRSFRSPGASSTMKQQTAANEATLQLIVARISEAINPQRIILFGS